MDPLTGLLQVTKDLLLQGDTAQGKRSFIGDQQQSRRPEFRSSVSIYIKVRVGKYTSNPVLGRQGICMHIKTGRSQGVAGQTF